MLILKLVEFENAKPSNALNLVRRMRAGWERQQTDAQRSGVRSGGARVMCPSLLKRPILRLTRRPSTCKPYVSPSYPFTISFSYNPSTHAGFNFNYSPITFWDVMWSSTPVSAEAPAWLKYALLAYFVELFVINHKTLHTVLKYMMQILVV